MSNHDISPLVASDLPIALYLNQRLTFDILASLEGGFSRFSSVQTTTSGKTATGLEGAGELGISNVFALFGVKLSGKGSKNSEQNQSESTTDEIVHTPASLFARLRKELSDRSLIQLVESAADLSNIRPGNFVEFEATLRKSPIVDLLSSYSELLSITDLFQEQPSAQQRGKSNRRPVSETSKVLQQINALQSVLTDNGSQDVIAEVDEMKVVLTVEQNYFVDKTMNDMIDGKFRVFGKATRIISSGSRENISLLRKSSFGKFGAMIDSIAAVMEGTSSDADLNFQGPVETEIKSPAMQVIPVAVFS